MKRVMNADPYGCVALTGYDAVAFHTEGQAVRGNPYIMAEQDGCRFLFASEENKAAFLADPEKYMPAYGGFCAFGVSLGVLFPVEIDTWTIIDGRLVLQFSMEFRKLFEEQQQENLGRADLNWLEIEKKNGLTAIAGG